MVMRTFACTVLALGLAACGGAPQPTGALAPPPLAESEPTAKEVLRLWAAPEKDQQVTLRTTWEDPGAWGLLLVDVAKHAANAYGQQGHDREKALARIKELFDAEWATATSEATPLGK